MEDMRLRATNKANKLQLQWATPEESWSSLRPASQDGRRAPAAHLNLNSNPDLGPFRSYSQHLRVWQAPTVSPSPSAPAAPIADDLKVHLCAPTREKVRQTLNVYSFLPLSCVGLPRRPFAQLA